jgi:hypothetical protein
MFQTIWVECLGLGFKVYEKEEYKSYTMLKPNKHLEDFIQDHLIGLKPKKFNGFQSSSLPYLFDL